MKGRLKHSHEDYAEAAEAAQRGYAWAQAAQLWQLAAGCCWKPHVAKRYERNEARCRGEMDVDAEMGDIARRVLDIPTLEERRMDSLDFHEVGVRSLKQALRLAYQAGRESK